MGRKKMVKITLTIPDNKLNDLKKGFLKAAPKPEEDKNLTDLQWFKKWLRKMVMNTYKAGKNQIACEHTPPDVDPDVVTDD